MLLTHLLSRFVQVVLAVATADIGPVHAHAYGERYDLPVPLWLNLTGAAAVVAFSFVIAAAVLRPAAVGGGLPTRWRLDTSAVLRPLTAHLVIVTVRLVVVALFVLALLTGFFGEVDFARNAAPTIIWALGWVGLAFVCALIGNVWLAVNPWLILFESAEALWRKLTGSALSLKLPYPEQIGVLPSIILMTGFVWFMLASGMAGEPPAIATMLTWYSLITWTGMMLFGAATWLGRGEVFTLIATILARFSPTELRVTAADICTRAGCPPDARRGCADCSEAFYRAPREAREINLRPYGAGLIVSQPLPLSMMILVLMVLALVSFEGFMDTAQWIELMVWLGEYERSDGIHAPGKTTALFLVTTALLYGVFYLVSALMRRLGYARGVAAGTQVRTTTEIMGLFVLSLVPIALAYHVAHYLYWLVTNIQYLIPAASDPFGWGWNLFGTRDYFPNRTAVRMSVIWHTAIAAIVVGHVIAVHIAHRVALSTFGSRRAAFWSQIPMLALMVAYTMSSLWMLAQPIMG